MDYKKITIFAGHYGSGKTNLAVNYAFRLKDRYGKVAVADLDIVNPYFRTKDSAEQLKAANIRLITSEYANTNAEIRPFRPMRILFLTTPTCILFSMWAGMTGGHLPWAGIFHIKRTG